MFVPLATPEKQLMSVNPSNLNELRQRLTEYLIAVSGSPRVKIGRLQPLTGGISYDNWLVDLSLDGVEHQMVLRRDVAGPLSSHALPREAEFAIMQHLRAAGVPLPQPHFFCVEPVILDGAFLMLDFLAGDSEPEYVTGAPELAEARRALPDQLARMLAHLHTVEPFAPGLAPLARPAPVETPAQAMISLMRTDARTLRLHDPALEFGLHWLEAHLPESRSAVIHGDFRLGNLIVGPAGLRAVIDWEYCHIGDPLADLATLGLRHWRGGQPTLRFAGIALNGERFLMAYEHASGRAVDRYALHWWEIAGNLRWALICAAQGKPHPPTIAVERARLARRMAEFQMEMLRLIAQSEE